MLAGGNASQYCSHWLAVHDDGFLLDPEYVRMAHIGMAQHMNEVMTGFYKLVEKLFLRKW